MTKPAPIHHAVAAYHGRTACGLDARNLAVRVTTAPDCRGVTCGACVDAVVEGLIAEARDEVVADPDLWARFETWAEWGAASKALDLRIAQTPPEHHPWLKRWFGEGGQ